MMTAEAEIIIPHDWRPRPYQLPLWSYFESNGRRAVAVWHRRAGKDSAALNITASKMFGRVGNYWHMLPQANQARKVIWDAIDRQGRRVIDQAFPQAIRRRTHQQEMKIELVNGSIWQCVGSDNYNSLVGANPVGIVFSEYSVADPQAWDYLRPMLAENGGWALFIYTPRGKNHGYELFKMAEGNPDWFCERLGVDDTGAIGPEIVEEERRSGMDEDKIAQEYFCSFDAALPGAYYARLLEVARNERRIAAAPWEPTLPVITAWDLGMSDATAIWFAQVAGLEVRLIDYYEATGAGLEHYAKVLGEKPYVYGEHYLPHDVQVRELGTGTSRYETLCSLGVRPRVLPALPVDDRINAARLLISRCVFDERKCERGLEALSQYQREWDEKTRNFAQRPYHDWTSHAADAFGYLAQGLRKPKFIRPAGGHVPQVTLATFNHDIFA